MDEPTPDTQPTPEVERPPGEPGPTHALDVAVQTDVGTARDHNEDACRWLADGPGVAIVAVADGVSSNLAGEVASAMAVEGVLQAYRDEPERFGPGQRLYRAVQRANIDVYDKSIAVPELRGMATTLTCAAFAGDELTIVHVGDSRLYQLRGGVLAQLTKDHTVAAEKARYGLLAKDRARGHPDASLLLRSIGRELIVSRDRTSHRLARGDVYLLCSDGLYNVLGDDEIADALAGRDAAEACRALVDRANTRGTADNLTAAVVRVVGEVPDRPRTAGLGGVVRRLLGRP